MIIHHASASPAPPPHPLRFLSRQSESPKTATSLHLPSTARHVTKHDFLPVWEDAWRMMQSCWGPEREIALFNHGRVCGSEKHLQNTTIHPAIYELQQHACCIEISALLQLLRVIKRRSCVPFSWRKENWLYGSVV